jgi:hypothetical protein
VRQLASVAKGAGPSPLSGGGGGGGGGEGGGRFTCMSFNILADMLASCEQFPSTEPSNLAWAARRALVEKEIAYHQPTILCVQELQGTQAGAGADDHHHELRAFLATHGYAGRRVT